MKSTYVFGAFQSWLVAWVKLLSSLVGILSLGFYMPGWDIDLMALFLKRFMRNYKHA